MNNLLQAAKQALETLEASRRSHLYCEDPWYSCPKHEDGCANELDGDECNCGADEANEKIDEAITALRAALAEPEQEPVAWMCSDESLTHKGYSRFSRTCEGAWNIPVYTAPTARKPLTDLEILAANKFMYNQHTCVYIQEDGEPENLIAFARAIERAHGIGAQHD